MNKITLKQASDILGTSRQNVCNLIKRGLLHGEKDKISNRILVNGDDVENLSNEYKEILSAEEEVRAKLPKIKKMQQEIETKFDEARRILTRRGDLKVDKNILASLLLSFYRLLSERDDFSNGVRIYCGFLEGKSIKELSKYCFGNENKVDLLLRKETRFFNDRLGKLNSILQDYKKTKAENASLKAQLHMLNRIRIVDTELSTRAKNSLLRAGVIYVDELLSFGLRDLLNLSSIGKGTVVEISDFIDLHKNK